MRSIEQLDSVDMPSNITALVEPRRAGQGEECKTTVAPPHQIHCEKGLHCEHGKHGGTGTCVPDRADEGEKCKTAGPPAKQVHCHEGFYCKPSGHGGAGTCVPKGSDCVSVGQVCGRKDQIERTCCGDAICRKLRWSRHGTMKCKPHRQPKCKVLCKLTSAKKDGWYCRWLNKKFPKCKCKQCSAAVPMRSIEQLDSVDMPSNITALVEPRRAGQGEECKTTVAPPHQIHCEKGLHCEHGKHGGTGTCVPDRADEGEKCKTAGPPAKQVHCHEGFYCKPSGHGGAGTCVPKGSDCVSVGQVCKVLCSKVLRKLTSAKGDKRYCRWLHKKFPKCKCKQCS